MTTSPEPTEPAAPIVGQIQLRPMQAADLDVLLPYEKAMFGTEAWSRRSYLDELADTELRHYIVAEGQLAEGENAEAAEGNSAENAKAAVLGNAGLMTIAETAQILTVAVLPQFRRAGLGRILVRGLVAEARRRNAIEVLLEVREDNEAARRLYESEGFEKLGIRRGYYDHGRVDAMTMRLDLQAGPATTNQVTNQVTNSTINPVTTHPVTYPVTMWEVRSADGQIEGLLAWVVQRVDQNATVYRGEVDDPLVVVIDPSGQAAAALADPPAELVARAPHSWQFAEVRNG
jgi:ribosomal-protein-alanine N-acetyltransferase